MPSSPIHPGKLHFSGYSLPRIARAFRSCRSQIMGRWRLPARQNSNYRHLIHLLVRVKLRVGVSAPFVLFRKDLLSHRSTATTRQERSPCRTSLGQEPPEEAPNEGEPNPAGELPTDSSFSLYTTPANISSGNPTHPGVSEPTGERHPPYMGISVAFLTGGAASADRSSPRQSSVIQAPLCDTVKA